MIYFLINNYQTCIYIYFQTSADLFVGVEPETASQAGGEATALNTQLAASQTVPRYPGLRDSSNSDSKSGSESKEGTKSKNKEDQDNGKSQMEEEKDRGKTQNVDNQRGKGKITPIDSDHDSRKRNGAGDDREKGKNWSDSRNRRSKSLSHESSRLLVKDSRRGSTYPPRNNKAINELKDNNKKQMEEQPKLELRKPISSLARIPKRTGTYVDERVMEKDHDERRLSSSNKRDLDERHDYREHEPVRSSKKPRISQERDVPTMEPVTVHTKMNEDIR